MCTQVNFLIFIVSPNQAMHWHEINISRDDILLSKWLIFDRHLWDQWFYQHGDHVLWPLFLQKRATKPNPSFQHRIFSDVCSKMNFELSDAFRKRGPWNIYIYTYCLFIVCIQCSVNYAILFILFLLFCLEVTLYLSILFGECIVLHSTVLALLLSCFVTLFAHWDGYVWYCKPCVVFCDARGMIFQPSVYM